MWGVIGVAGRVVRLAGDVRGGRRMLVASCWRRDRNSPPGRWPRWFVTDDRIMADSDWKGALHVQVFICSDYLDHRERIERAAA